MGQNYLSKSFVILCILLFNATFGYAQEPYAVLSDNNTILTFRYDEHKVDYGGLEVKNYSKASKRGWAEQVSSITKVVFDPSFASCTSIQYPRFWFLGCSNLIQIVGLEYFNTSNVKDMQSFFSGCSSLSSLDLTHFDTSNVENMSEMFSGCSSLSSLDLTHFDTSKVTKMDNMFLNCSSLKSLDVSKLNTSNV
ncbi:MAG: BspA family leucine-rich repeat surface protein, partial [Aeriscardovia sp.]|nr:BspA family leucine-rich repeat surface protein [Aeriscardovia sp.]